MLLFFYQKDLSEWIREESLLFPKALCFLPSCLAVPHISLTLQPFFVSLWFTQDRCSPACCVSLNDPVCGLSICPKLCALRQQRWISAFRYETQSWFILVSHSLIHTVAVIMTVSVGWHGLSLWLCLQPWLCFGCHDYDCSTQVYNGSNREQMCMCTQLGHLSFIFNPCGNLVKMLAIMMLSFVLSVTPLLNLLK